MQNIEVYAPVTLHPLYKQASSSYESIILNVLPANKRRQKSRHVLTSRHARTLADNNTKGKKKQINKERMRSKIKINTNRKGEQSEVAGGGGG